jgi:hypothetical protein
MAEQSEQLERGRFEGEVLARLTSLDQKLSSILTGQTDHEKRLRCIEESSAKMKGISMAMSALVASVISLLGVASDWFHK